MEDRKVTALDRANRYANGVLYGSIPSCKMVHCACQRWRDDWKRDDIYYDSRPVEMYMGFVSQLKHYKGALAGQYIHLEDWQVFVVANVFGWHYHADQCRRYRYVDVFVPRKNGKTTFAASIADFCLLFDREAGAEVYSSAVDREQARICFEASLYLLKGSIFERLITSYSGSIVVKSSASSYKPLSKDTKNKDGLSPHCTICDERHAWATNEIFDVIKTGMGARSQPIIFSISTAGTDTSYPYYSDLEVLRDVMRGLKDKDNHFILLYEPDEGDSWDDPAVWRKVNPNFGVSLSERYMQEEYEDAKLKGGQTLASFCTKNLNMWVDAPEVWIQDDDVQACNQHCEIPLAGEDVYVGVDLASKTDISAVALYFPQHQYVKYLFVIPEAKVEAETDRVDYRRWAEDGWLTIAPGKVLDEDWFVTFLLRELEPYHVMKIAYDPWGMWKIADKLTRYSDALMEYQQSIRYMSVPTKEFESMVLQRRICFGGNPVIRWMMKNVVIYIDPNGNIKLDKARSRNKIDGVVATVDAIGGWLNSEHSDQRIYESHDLRTFSF